MLSIRKSLPAVAIVLCLLALGLAGCGGGGGSSSLRGTGTLSVGLVDAPIDADEVNISITSVQVHSAGGGWVTVKTYETPLEVNLLDYSDPGVTPLPLLADTPLAVGHYTQVRLMLSAAEIVVAGVPHQVDLQNVAQNGVKCNGQFSVTEGQLMAIKLDFDASRSFIENPPGSGNYKLQPVMSMSPVNVAAEVTGTVAFTDGTNPLPLPAAVEVNVYPAGQIGVASALVAGTAVLADGTFRIGCIAAGTYDLEIVADGVPVKQMPATVVTSPTTSLGTVTVTVTPPAPPGG